MIVEAGGKPGINGGSTTFGSLLRCPGGQSVSLAPCAVYQEVSAGYAGGFNGTGGVLSISGGFGGAAVGYQSGDVFFAVSGYGGGSFFGAGASSVSVIERLILNGLSGNSPGSGGSGAASTYNSNSAIGGNGAPGMCIVTEYILV